LGANERDEPIRGLKAEGASLRRISRLTGISVGVIRRRQPQKNRPFCVVSVWFKGK
jgi:hypothetical protein